MTTPLYALTLDMSVIRHLGIGLYSNIPAVLSEMVANAWDAGATVVQITLSTDYVVIEDNGKGLSPEDVNDRFLRIGYQKRREESTVQAGNNTRYVMGRKGIGKLAAFSIADTLEVQTCKDDIQSGFLMQWPLIEEAIDRGDLQYNPQSMSVEQLDITSGTKITLRDIKLPLMGIEGTLRTELARRFSVIGDDRSFDVVINGEPLSLKDRNYYDKIQFMWYFGEESSKYAARCPKLARSVRVYDVVDAVNGYAVSGWIATIYKPKQIDDRHHVISVFARGKLIQEDILFEFRDARHFRGYIIGEIDADFMDDDADADIVTSDRQRINTDDPRYGLLRDFIIKELRNIGNSWDKLRNQEKTQRLKQGEQQKVRSDIQGQLETVNFLPADVAPADVAPVDVAPVEFVPPQADLSKIVAETPVLLTSASSGNQNVQNESGTEIPASHESAQIQKPPTREAQTFFRRIHAFVDASDLESSFKQVIHHDLSQAKVAYEGGAYKASVVMLGAVLEGIMLGTLRRPEVMKHIRDNFQSAPQVLKSLGVQLQSPRYDDQAELAKDLALKLKFEGMRQIIHHYLPFIGELGTVDIQRFRNAVHPWNCIEKPDVYGKYIDSMAMKHLASLEVLAERLLAWDPSAQMSNLSAPDEPKDTP